MAFSATLLNRTSVAGAFSLGVDSAGAGVRPAPFLSTFSKAVRMDVLDCDILPKFEMASLIMIAFYVHWVTPKLSIEVPIDTCLENLRKKSQDNKTVIESSPSRAQ
jgi:hypothetical protein